MTYLLAWVRAERVLSAPVQSAIMSLHYSNRSTPKMGRPPLKSGLLRNQVFQMRVSNQFLRSIDTWRERQRDRPSRAEAIHQLVEQALAGKGSARKSRKGEAT